MIISLVSIKVYGYFEPFVEDADDHIAELSQYAIFLTLLSALMLKVDRTGINETALGLLLLFINSLALFLAIFAVAYEPLVLLFNLFLKIHVHHGEFKELKKEYEHDTNKVKEYFQKLCGSNFEQAGWERVRNFSSGVMSRNFEQLVDAKAEWRSSTGYGAYDQMRVKCTLGGKKQGQQVDYDYIKKFIVNKEHNKKAKVLKEHDLKHISDSEKHVYKVFSVFPFAKHRDAVLEVTSREEYNEENKRVFTHIGRALSSNQSESLFPKKTSSRLKRCRAGIVFEGYQMKELDGGEVEVIYTTEMNLGGYMTSNFFLRKYYYSMFKFKVEELYDFSVDPEKWFLPFELEDESSKRSFFGSFSLFGGSKDMEDDDQDDGQDNGQDDFYAFEDEKERLSEHELIKFHERKDRKEYGKKWGKDRSDSSPVEDDEGKKGFDSRKSKSMSRLGGQRGLQVKKQEVARDNKVAEQFGQYKYIIEQQKIQLEKINDKESNLKEKLHRIEKELQRMRERRGAHLDSLTTFSKSIAQPVVGEGKKGLLQAEQAPKVLELHKEVEKPAKSPKVRAKEELQKEKNKKGERTKTPSKPAPTTRGKKPPPSEAEGGVDINPMIGKTPSKPALTAREKKPPPSEAEGGVELNPMIGAPEKKKILTIRERLELKKKKA
eukprot:CAMPEP_0182497088 /NCGR_PEP_ID=MMETSP1321-20130603/5635_1 /TAXON_ID=91990 /ORGANISM="Bolidomonas sp., Strain RCC1657" /LENGTH=660 /DNA_ID=CAMNT_0024700859 /DNA_START=98 /DNA_END=2077 /DNA_ORIENTATION=+